MDDIDARGMKTSDIYGISLKYPPNLYRQIGITYSHETTEDDIARFREAATKKGAIAIMVQEYGQSAYIPIE